MNTTGWGKRADSDTGRCQPYPFAQWLSLRTVLDTICHFCRPSPKNQWAVVSAVRADFFSNPGLSISRKHEQVGQMALQAPHETQVDE